MNTAKNRRIFQAQSQADRFPITVVHVPVKNGLRPIDRNETHSAALLPSMRRTEKNLRRLVPSNHGRESMNTPLEAIIKTLREELTEYGGLLRLFEIQQRALVERDANAVLLHATSIEAQTRTLSDCRQRRHKIVAAFALEQGSPASSTLRSLLPLVTEPARPLLEALIDESNRLLHRVRRTSRYNHALLARAVEVHQETLSMLRPQRSSESGSASHRVLGSGGVLKSKLRAAS